MKEKHFTLTSGKKVTYFSFEKVFTYKGSFKVECYKMIDRNNKPYGIEYFITEKWLGGDDFEKINFNELKECEEGLYWFIQGLYSDDKTALVLHGNESVVVKFFDNVDDTIRSAFHEKIYR